MLTLIGFARSRASRPLVFSEELGVPDLYRPLHRGRPQDRLGNCPEPEWSRFGLVESPPALWESMAIGLYVTERYALRRAGAQARPAKAGLLDATDIRHSMETAEAIPS